MSDEPPYRHLPEWEAVLTALGRLNEAVDREYGGVKTIVAETVIVTSTIPLDSEDGDLPIYGLYATSNAVHSVSGLLDEGILAADEMYRKRNRDD